ncbi:hypothetical protein D9M71_260360 [compost metagenome]
MAEANVGGGRDLDEVMLVADKTAGQGVCAGIAVGGAGFPVVLGRGTVQARAGDHAVLLGGIPGQFAERAVVVEVGVFGPGHLLVHVNSHAAALAVFVGLRIDASDQLQLAPAPGALDPAAHGAAVDVADHRHTHHPRARGRAQAVVVHHMVGVVVVDLGFELVEDLADVGLLEAQAKAFALELRTVHATAGIAGLAVALAGGQFHQGIGVRGPAQGHVAVPLVPARRHGVAIAVFIVVGARLVADETRIAVAVARCGIQHLVEAAVGAAQQAGIDPAAKLAEFLRLAIEEDGPGRGARAPDHALRTLDHGQAVIGFRRDVRGGGVHAVGAGAEHHAAVGEDVQARAEHAAQHRVAIGAAGANRREAGDGLQVIGAITGRYRLAWVLGVGDDGQRRAGGDGGDHRRAQLVMLMQVLVMALAGGQDQGAEQGAANHGDGPLQGQTKNSGAAGHNDSNIDQS